MIVISKSTESEERKKKPPGFYEEVYSGGARFGTLRGGSLFGGRVRERALGLWEAGACTLLPRVATQRRRMGRRGRGGRVESGRNE